MKIGHHISRTARATSSGKSCRSITGRFLCLPVQMHLEYEDAQCKGPLHAVFKYQTAVWTVGRWVMQAASGTYSL